ncbi:MAG: hypothetical protein ACRD63_14125 [Pyrinomonadaceae bacterium]
MAGKYFKLLLIVVLASFLSNISYFQSINVTSSVHAQATTLEGDGGRPTGLDEHALGLSSVMANILLMSMKF